MLPEPDSQGHDRELRVDAERGRDGGAVGYVEAADAVDSAGQMLMWLVYALLIVGALWVAAVVAGIVRRVRR